MFSPTKWIVALCFSLVVTRIASAQITARVSVDSSGIQANFGGCGRASLSADGRHVAFLASASNLVPGDSNGTYDVFVHDRQTGATTRVSVSSGGSQSNLPCNFPFISADGRFVAFDSLASTLVSGDTNGISDIFVHDRQTGQTTRESVTSGGSESFGPSGSVRPSISADGRFVVFESEATNLVVGDTNGTADIFIRDRVAGVTSRVSVDSGGFEVAGHSRYPSLSADGWFVAFTSGATTLVAGDTNGAEDIFVHDRQTGVTTRVSIGSAGSEANAGSQFSSTSGDGRFVSFRSLANNLFAGDTNGLADVFVHDRATASTTLVSVARAGQGASGASGHSSISSDGRFVAFDSAATNLVPGDTNGTLDVFLRDCVLGVTTLLSSNTAGSQGLNLSQGPSVSADARYVGFESFATNLVAGDTNGILDVFIRDRGQASAFSSFCFGDGSSGACPCGNLGSFGRGCDNSASTGGALLVGSGSASLSADTASLTVTNELPNSPSLVVHGNVAIPALPFADGVRCTGGPLTLRLYIKPALGGAFTVPQVGDPSLSARSAVLGDLVLPGSTRIYQVYYRDSNLVFCPGGANWTNAVAIVWSL